MADASREPPAHGWGDVFAALPLESPPASRWPQLAARLDARGQPARKPRIWLALAAGLCALAALPLAWTLRDAGDGAITGSSANTAATLPIVPPPAHAEPAVETFAKMPATPPVTAAARTGSLPATRTTRVDERRSPTQPRERDAAAIAIGGGPATTSPADSASGDTLESLYAASAQLETLLAAARDIRVESGPAAALAGDIDAELATIDAHLAQPDLANSERLTLWQARVETLQASAGFESQLRLLAARGGQLDGALVSID
jgi:hypothetical protein